MNPEHVNGIYNPAAFFMEVDTNEEFLNLDQFGDDVFYTICHEYIHFLQDISNTFGLINVYNFVNDIQQISQIIVQDGNYKFPVPLNSPAYAIIDQQTDLIELYRGSWEVNTDIETIQRCKIVDSYYELTKNPEDEQKAEVTYLSEHGSEERFYLGSHIIQESMAANLETYLGSDYNYTTFPYTTVEKIISDCYPNNFNISHENIFVLCDIALDSTNPGVNLINILEEIKKSGVQINTPDDIYNFYNKHPEYHTEYEKYSDETRNQLVSFFADKDEEAHRTWCNSIIEAGKKLRSEITIQDKSGSYLRDSNGNDKFPWTSFLLNPDNENKKNKVRFLMTITGLPLIKNKTGKLFATHSFRQMGNSSSLIRAIYDVHRILKSGARSCSMKQFCLATDPPKVDHRCDSSPWERANEKTLCPFAKLWDKLGLKGYSPEDKNS